MLIDPVSRKQLINYYQDADFLFLHLNDLEAFKKVLPSKIFEYAVFNKPIIAGVSGYASDFIRTNFQNFILFSPTNTDDFVTQLQNYNLSNVLNTEFVEKFARKNIMKEMANSILAIIKN